MSLFNDALKSGESLFLNEFALDYNFVPKLLPYREGEQRHLATCIMPLLQNRNGRNLLIHGAPGIGKTAAMRWVFRDLENETDDVIPIYVNCWQKNTSYKIVLEICETLGYRLTHNKRTEELLDVVKEFANKKPLVFAFDEIDKVDDYGFLYTLLEDIFKKSIFLITNHKDWLLDMDQRIKSRLTPEMVEFKKYNLNEIKGILKERAQYALVPGTLEQGALDIIAEKTHMMEDIRTGIYLLREAALIAESKSSKKITEEHAKAAMEKLEEFSAKKKEDMEDEMKMMLEIVKKNSGQKIGDLFKTYQAEGGNLVYKSFQRKMRKLADGKFVTIQTIKGGSEGTTSIITYQTTKKLTEF
ncbi:TPA: AAA family ATPase [Candidatus Woesearchaeota archaeon]|nr:AAA family ATPase [Candidatus Woesearchaeota archaeon]